MHPVFATWRIACSSTSLISLLSAATKPAIPHSQLSTRRGPRPGWCFSRDLACNNPTNPLSARAARQGGLVHGDVVEGVERTFKSLLHLQVGRHRAVLVSHARELGSCSQKLFLTPKVNILIQTESI